MSFTNVSLVHVAYVGAKMEVAMGRLALVKRKIFFEYDNAFLKSGLELSPFKLPLRPGVFACDDAVFDGLFGVFNDSLPDGWGRLLLDRKLRLEGVNPLSLTPLDRLCYVGGHGMGALSYSPEKERHAVDVQKQLDEIAEEIAQFQESDDEAFVDELYEMNGSSAGARPKILAAIDGDHWLIKFRASTDPKDSGPLEYAYHLMAQASKIDVPKARLFKSKNGPGYFGVKRFDLVGSTRMHMHTLGGLLHADHRLPSLDYETVLRATLSLTKDARECEAQFRRAVFNVLTHNRDDHCKNFSYLMGESGRWHISPAYDLVFSSGPAGEHSTTIMGEGKNPSIDDLRRLAEASSLKKATSQNIIQEVLEAVSGWEVYSKEAGLSKSTSQMVRRVLERLA